METVFNSKNYYTVENSSSNEDIMKALETERDHFIESMVKRGEFVKDAKFSKLSSDMCVVYYEDDTISQDADESLQLFMLIFSSFRSQFKVTWHNENGVGWCKHHHLTL